MALIGNNTIVNRVLGRKIGGTVISGYPDAFSPPASWKNRQYGGYDEFSATPNGYTHPAAWVLGKQSGGLASYKQLSALISETNAALAQGIAIDAALSAQIVISNAVLQIIVALEAALAGTGTITNAQLALVLQMASSLSAAGQITNADLGNILGLIAALSAQGVFTDVAEVTLVNLSADISNAEAGALTAADVWNYDISAIIASGTGGKTVNDILTEVEKRLKTSTFIALK